MAEPKVSQANFSQKENIYGVFMAQRKLHSGKFVFFGNLPATNIRI